MKFPENTLAHVDCHVSGDLMRKAFGPDFPKNAEGSVLSINYLSIDFMKARYEAEQARIELLEETLKPALHALMGMFEGQHLVGDFQLALVLLKPEIGKPKVA